MRLVERVRRLGGCLLAAILCVAMAATVSGQTKKFLGGPLVIEDQGSFFIGGVPKITDHITRQPRNAGTDPAPPVAATPQQITVGQMYVQFQILCPRFSWTRIKGESDVQGGSGNGSVEEGEGSWVGADGREGWAPYFVGHQVPAYIVDQAGRGRSGFDPSVIHEGEARMTGVDLEGATDLIPRFGRITDTRAWESWFGHLVPSGSTILTGTLIPHGDPGDPNPNPDAFQHVTPVFPIDAVDPAVLSRAGARGPAPAGSGAYHALEYYKQLVPNAEVTLPDSTCRTCDPSTLSPANTWTPQNLATLVERLGGAVVVTPLAIGNHGASYDPHPEGTGSVGVVEGIDSQSKGPAHCPTADLRPRTSTQSRIWFSKEITRRYGRGAKRTLRLSGRGGRRNTERRRRTISSWTKWASLG